MVKVINVRKAHLRRGVRLLDLFTVAGMFRSKSDGRRVMRQGGFYMLRGAADWVRVENPDATLWLFDS